MTMPEGASPADQAALYAELEALVVREMQTSVEREQAMQLVLDSMHDGLLVCELDGSASPIRSRALTAVFGEPGDQKVWSYLGGGHDDFSLRFEIGWDQAVGDLLPFELAASQMPAELQRGERTYRLAYQRVERDGALNQIAVSVRDVTDELAAQRAQELAVELAAIVRCLMVDRPGFVTFLDEVDQLLIDLAEGDPARALHTLKGNTAMFGFGWFSARCHELEDELAAGGELDADRLDRLRRNWHQALEQIRPFLGSGAADDIVIARDELEGLLARLGEAGVPPALIAGLADWQHEPVGPCLERLARQAQRIADLQGKQLAIVLEGGRVRCGSERLRKLMAPLIHAVRNAVDHGLEPPDERLATGKPEAGRLLIACRLGSELVVEIRDDGRGIAWDKVRAKARALGLADAEEALFADGVSTAAEVSHISGRGVGLGALRQTCRELGGSIAIESDPGHGTRVICRVPR